MRIRATIATIALTCGIVLFAAAPATAESGTVKSIGEGASTHFDDSVDKYTVCDLRDDGLLAAGWIEVEQPDGSWHQYPKEIVVGGIEHCNPKDVEVQREDARVRVVACQKHPGGAVTGCNDKILAGS